MKFEKNDLGILVPVTENEDAIPLSELSEQDIPEAPEVNKNKPTLLSVHDSVKSITKSLVESCSDPKEKVISCPRHAFFHASYVAFNNHRPLVLSPDILWLTILQGVSFHVQEHSEELRDKFVNFEGKKLIRVIHNGLVKGKMNNPWPDVFSSFSNDIKKNIGQENYDRLVVRFSTTGLTEQAAMECALMDIVKQYFDYRCATLCGVPEIILEGEKKDYETLCEKAQQIGESYDLVWWTKDLLPLLNLIHESFDNKEKRNSLRHNWFNIGGGSGGPYFTGYAMKFFPYLIDYDKIVKNYYFDNNSYFDGITTDNIPQGMRSVPFIWEYYLTEYKMNFLTGFVGVSYNENNHSIRPKIGWAVQDAENSKDPEQWKTCSICKKEKTIQEMHTERTIFDFCERCYYEMPDDELVKRGLTE